MLNKNEEVNISANNGSFTTSILELPDYTNHVIVAVGATISLLGFVGNFFTLVKIISDRNLHRTAYTAVACLAVADILCIVLQSVRLILGRAVLSEAEKIIILSVTSSVVCSSAIHNIILSAIKCCMIVNPITSRFQLSPLKVIMASLIGWIVCILIGCFYAYYNVLFYASKIDHEFDALVQVSFAVCILIIPVIFFVIFFILEYQALRYSRLPTINENKRRLTNMIKIVLILYVVCLTPYVVTDVLRVIHERHGLITRESYYNLHKNFLVPISKVFFILNPSVNPFIYFLYAKPWTNSICYAQSTVITRRNSPQVNFSTVRRESAASQTLSLAPQVEER